MNIILLGGPSSGKGTQAELLSKKLGIPQISTGQLFRKISEEKTPLAEKVNAFMKAGDLVPDEIVMEVFEQRITSADCDRGAILDGFPRTLNQAQQLEILFNKLGKKLDTVIYINVPIEVMQKRITGRWSCKQEGHIYHEVYNPPKTTGICDIDGSELYQREDQNPEIVKERIHTYIELTTPLIDFYKQLGILQELNGDQDINQIHESISEKLDEI